MSTLKSELNRQKPGIRYRVSRVSLTSIWLGGALALAAGLKWALAAMDTTPFNADEAVVALMARHILQGERPVFFYGQAYMGSLDAFLVAAGFAFFGEHVWVLRSVQVALYLGTIASTTALGKAALGSWRTGVLAAWCLAVPTVNVTLYTTATLGGYGEMLLLGNLILLAALRIAMVENEKAIGIRSIRGSWLAFGFLAGLGLWAFGLTLVYSIPAVIFLAWTGWSRRMKPRLAEFGLAIFGGLLGASPWWGYASRSGIQALVGELSGTALAGVEGAHYLAQVAHHIFNLAVLGIPVIFGLRPPWEVRWMAKPLLPFALAFWLGVSVYIVNRIKSGAAHREQNHGGETNGGAMLLAGVMLSLAAGFVLTPFGVDPSGRYFLPLAIPLALFGAEWTLRLRQARGRLAWVLAGLVLAFNLWGTLESVRRNPPGLTTQFDAQTRIDHRYDRALVEFLQENGEQRGYTHYWVAYPLAFHSQEKLIFIPGLPYHLDLRYTPRDDRYPPYTRAVAQSQRVAYITTEQPALEARLQASFQALDVHWKEARIGDYHVYYRLSRAVRPDEIGLDVGP